MQKLKQNLLLVFTLVPFIMQAQFDITGTVVGQDNSTIATAEVIVLSNENSALVSQLTDEQGNFKVTINQGNYILQIKQLGVILLEKNVTIFQNTNLGILNVDDSKKLEEIVISTKKKLIERKVDRLVFNVQNSVRASSGDALDALKVTPGIRVQNETIAMIGKSDMGVLVNDKLVQLSGEELINYLKTITADNIKSIEVITTPPAKYSAEGNSGLVNIILKKVKQNSWSASLKGSYRQATYGTSGTGGTFTFQKNKHTMVASTNYSNGSYYGLEESIIKYPTQLWESKGSGKYYTNLWSNRLGYDYQVSKKWSFGVQYIGSFNKPDINDASLATMTDNISQNTNAIINSNGQNRKKIILNSLNAHTNMDLDTVGRKMSLDIDYLDYKSTNNRNFYTATTANSQSGLQNGSQNTLNQTENNIKNLSAQVHIDHPLKWAKINYGLRFSFSNTNNDIALYDLSGMQPTLNNAQSNVFEYIENTQAAYISGNKSFGKNKWELQVGLRVENTQTKGNSISLNQVNKNSYFRWFPTLYLLHKINDNKTITLSYSKRIFRPNFNNLNPFRWYSSQYSYSEGNPNLIPGIANNFELNYNYKDNLNTTVYFSKGVNNFGQVVTLNTDDYVQRITRLNYFSNYSAGITQNYSYTGKKWWENQNTISIFFQHSDSYIYPVTPQSNESFSAYISSSNNFILNKTVSSGFEVTHYFPNQSGDLTYNYARTYLSFFVQASFLNRKLQTTFVVENILKTNDFNNSSIRNGFDASYKGYYDSRYIGVQLVYKMGSSKVNARNRKVSNEQEKNRIN